VFIACARYVAAAASGTNETEDWMVVRERRDVGSTAASRPLSQSGQGNQASSGTPNTWKLAALDQSPNRRARDAKNMTGLVNRH
jgi:hypothetical protein